MIRRISRIRVQPRRKCTPSSAPEAEVLSAALTAEQIDLNAHLHEQAAQSVATTLTRMQQRTQQAADTTPELAPLLTAYFHAASTSLLHHTLELLADPPQSPIPPARPPRRPSWPFAIRRLMPVRRRKEQPGGPA
jgi:hypothetical protein